MERKSRRIGVGCYLSIRLFEKRLTKTFAGIKLLVKDGEECSFFFLSAIYPLFWLLVYLNGVSNVFFLEISCFNIIEHLQG